MVFSWATWKLVTYFGWPETIYTWMSPALRDRPILKAQEVYVVCRKKVFLVLLAKLFIVSPFLLLLNKEGSEVSEYLVLFIFKCAVNAIETTLWKFLTFHYYQNYLLPKLNVLMIK